MRSPRSGAETTVDVLLAQVGHLQHVSIRRGIESFGLYRGQPRMLDILWEQEGLTHTDLATQMNVQPATVSKMVQRMERSGFVERRRDPNDERVSRVFLTERGRAMQTQVEAWFAAFQASYIEGLSDEEVATLQRLLAHIRDRLATQYADGEVWPEPHCRPAAEEE